jgi:hypothetical protein
MSCPAMRKRANCVEPVFLFCVGATKAGTSWLYEQLRIHPECHLRTIKEYHYFTLKNPEHWDKRLSEMGGEIARAEQDGSQAARLADLRAWSQVIAARRFDLDLYRGFHFDDLQGRKLVGDVTPAYSLLTVKTLEKMKSVAKNLRIVYLIRDPLARLWSHIRMSADRAQPEEFAQAAQTLLQRTLAGQSEGGIQGMVRRGDYLTNLPKLQRAFGANLLVMFTEDLMTSLGFARLLDFLGLSPIEGQLDKTVHEGRALSFPDDLRAKTLQFLRPQYDFIASEFPVLPAAWRRNMNEALT